MAVMIPLCATILPFSVILRRRIKPEAARTFAETKLTSGVVCIWLRVCECHDLQIFFYMDMASLGISSGGSETMLSSALA